MTGALEKIPGREVLRRLGAARIASVSVTKGGTVRAELELDGRRTRCSQHVSSVHRALGLEYRDLTPAAHGLLQQLRSSIFERLAGDRNWQARLERERRRDEGRARLAASRRLADAIQGVAVLAAELGVTPDTVISEVSSRIREEFCREIQEA